jgi:hypothetical protein
VPEVVMTRRTYAHHWRQGTLLGALVVVVVSTAGAQANGIPPAPRTGFPLTSWQEISAGRNSGSVYFRNETGRPIVVNTVTLAACENVSEACDEQAAAVNVKVPPGRVVEALQVHRRDPGKGWSFAFWFEAGKRPESEPVSLRVGEAVTPHTVVSVDQVAPIGGAITEAAKCTPTHPRGLPAEHRVLVMLFTSAGFTATRSVVVWFDGAGAAYRYQDRRGHPDLAIASRVRDVVLTSTIHSPEPSALIQLDLAHDNGTVVTSDGEGGEITTYVAGPNLLTAESLGRPADLIARIWKECKNTR